MIKVLSGKMWDGKTMYMPGDVITTLSEDEEDSLVEANKAEYHFEEESEKEPLKDDEPSKDDEPPKDGEPQGVPLVDNTPEDVPKNSEDETEKHPTEEVFPAFDAESYVAAAEAKKPRGGK